MMNASQVELIDARHEGGDVGLLRVQIVAAVAAVVVMMMMPTTAAVVTFHQEVILRLYVRREAVRQSVLRHDSNFG